MRKLKRLKRLTLFSETGVPVEGLFAAQPTGAGSDRGLGGVPQGQNSAQTGLRILFRILYSNVII